MHPDDYPDWLRAKRDESWPIAAVMSPDITDHKDDPLLRDVAFNRHSMNDGHHVSPSDNAMIQVGTDNIRVELVQGIDVEQLKKTLTAAVRATIGLDLSQTLPGDWEPCNEGPSCQKHNEHDYRPAGTVQSLFGRVPMEDWEEMLKGGLQTALETQTIVLAVSGVSRTCTHQLVRSRKAAFHQQSQRASYMGDAPECRMPESVYKNRKARFAFYKATMACWRAYRDICEEDISYQDARYVLPEGTTSFILLEYTIREFLNVYAYRACSMFSWEIVHVMREAKKVLVSEYPWMEPYIKISCEKTGPAKIPSNRVELGMPNLNPDLKVEEVLQHHCTFQGWENVEGQCSFPWAREEARTFKPQFHKIERTKENNA